MEAMGWHDRERWAPRHPEEDSSREDLSFHSKGVVHITTRIRPATSRHFDPTISQSLFQALLGKVFEAEICSAVSNPF